MACFADSNVSQGSVATYASCGGIFDIHITANLPRSLPVKKQFFSRLRIDRIMVMSLWPRFLAHPVYRHAWKRWQGEGAMVMLVKIMRRSMEVERQWTLIVTAPSIVLAGFASTGLKMTAFTGLALVQF